MELWSPRRNLNFPPRTWWLVTGDSLGLRWMLNRKEYPVRDNISTKSVACVFYDRKSSQVTHPIIVLNAENFTSTDRKNQRKRPSNAKIKTQNWRCFHTNFKSDIKSDFFFASNFISIWFDSSLESGVALCDNGTHSEKLLTHEPLISVRLFRKQQ